MSRQPSTPCLSICRVLQDRSQGRVSSAAAAEIVRCGRLRRLELNVNVEIKSNHNGPIIWLDIDGTEGRYLLTGGADCTIAIFDLDGRGDQHGFARVGNRSDGTGGVARARGQGGRGGNHGAYGCRGRSRGGFYQGVNGVPGSYPRELREICRTRRMPAAG
ncbi:unnamed protein product, partial [Discosporangium mesarthrocarpum]